MGYIAGAGHDNQIFFGALLELLLIIANIGTAVVIFPIVKRQSEELALGYVTARMIECTFILVGIVCGPRDHHVAERGRGRGRRHGRLHARGDQGLDVPPRARLGRRLGKRADPRLPDVPLGAGAATGVRGSASSAGRCIILSGTPSCSASTTKRRHALQAIATIPEFLWELFLGVYCTFKGFRPSSPILRADTRYGSRGCDPPA